jgi:hypothetical protein
MNPELAKEIAIRIDDMQSDEDFMADNENPSAAELEIFAMEDIEAMGDDFGGAFRPGILPTILGADGKINSEAMQRQAEFAADQTRQHKQWRSIRRAAIRELAKRKA